MYKTIRLQKEIQDDAIRFGNEANLARAIPYIRDGLKPSQRYTIYTAFNHGYSSNKPHIKSLKLDGQIVGEAWPHGSEYQTIVRLTQPFIMNIPLLDMHGANGSQLGTNAAAASRYTEVRLATACEEGLLKNIKKNVVDFIPNYSEDLMLPKLLPALLPNLYVNGSDGIAYCYSQTWLPGNLNEFTEQVQNYLKNKSIDYTKIAFDFPTGGIIINKKDLPNIYKTGIGTVLLRGKVSIVDNYTIKITELPYQVYVTEFLQQIKNLISTNKISEICNVYNMSGDNGMDIEIECEKNTVQIVLQKLYKYSDLQVSLSVNQYGIIDSIPELINLEKYIRVYIDHNIKCIQREHQFDLIKASDRKEIIDGLLKAIANIDEVIKIIKTSKNSIEAGQNLIKKYQFSENQAKAIIDMKLGKLANLESIELQKEDAELTKEIEKCNKILSSDKLQQKEFLKRLEDFTFKYGWQRRTDLTDVDLEEEKKEIKQTKVDEKYIIVLDSQGRIRKTDCNNFKANKLDKNDIKYIEVDKRDRFILISDKGFMYKAEVNKLQVVNQGSAGTKFACLNKNENIINIFTGNETEEFLFFITEQGLAKKIEANIVFSLTKLAGAPVMKVNSADNIIYCENVSDKAIIKAIYNKKEKEIKVADFISKGRTAGGTVAIKVKNGLKINILK